MRIDGTRFEEARSDDAGQPNAEGAGFKGAGLIEMDETFYERVYEQVRKVPSGSVCTYGTIAELAGYPRFKGVIFGRRNIYLHFKGLRHRGIRGI